MNHDDFEVFVNLAAGSRLRQRALLCILERNEKPTKQAVEAEFKSTPRLIREKEIQKIIRFGSDFVARKV